MTSKSDIESADNIVGFYIALPPFVAVCSYKPDKIDRGIVLLYRKSRDTDMI
jgi:hypothetical protein